MAVKEITEQEFEEKVKSTDKKVMVDCYATWCGPCQMLAPIVDQLSDEVEDCDFYKLNIDEAEEIAGQYDIMSIPTLLVFENKELKTKLVGFRTKEELKKAINEAE